jgi:polyisoprenoid-binding protein YceI
MSDKKRSFPRDLRRANRVRVASCEAVIDAAEVDGRDNSTNEKRGLFILRRVAYTSTQYYLTQKYCCNEYNSRRIQSAERRSTMTTMVAPLIATTTWNIDPVHSVAEFKVKHMMISNVKGQFTGVSGTLTLDEADVTKSKIDAIIDAASINTREPDRDKHLKSADFFDVEKFPTLAFKSGRVTRKGEEEFAVEGDLTILGVTRHVVFAVEGPTAPGKDPWGNTRIGISATTKINRKDYGLTWNAALETGGILVGDEVTITLDVQFVKA